MPQYTFHINGLTYDLEVDSKTPLLWVLRDYIGLTGTKYGCGIGQCGACTVHIEGQPGKSCLINAESVSRKEITTIEGITEVNVHPIQRAWMEAQVPQCGYCQSGQIMTAVALLKANPQPTQKDIQNAMNQVLCRCGTYPRIQKAWKIILGQNESS